MPARHLPVRPDLEQLRHQAKDLLRLVRHGDPTAVAEFRAHHPQSIDPADARLADAQVALARSYGLTSWPRLVVACRIIDAIWRDDHTTVRNLVLKQPALLREPARGGEQCNWGPPMSYAANLGRDRIIAMLRDLGADDVQFAFERAVLQGRLDTARLLADMGARPMRDSIMGPAETLSGAGMAHLLDLGAEISDEHGDRFGPVAMVLQTYARNPAGKHECLELLAKHGIDLPDTPPMAVHRGRIDLLEQHFQSDPALPSRTFTHREIWPPSLGCTTDESLALHGTPLGGATLLHMAIDYDEMEIARWLLDHGASPDVRAAVDVDGFGGHTPLFSSVVSQVHRARRRNDDRYTRLLLERNADPNARASLRKRLPFTDDDSMHEYRDVTPLAWGRRFHDQAWVSAAAMRLVAEAGGMDPGETAQSTRGS
jgi:hypothetical protein